MSNSPTLSEPNAARFSNTQDDVFGRIATRAGREEQGKLSDATLTVWSTETLLAAVLSFPRFFLPAPPLASR